jgi:tripartite ATP-independent transporter DctM subunit
MMTLLVFGGLLIAVLLTGIHVSSMMFLLAVIGDRIDLGGSLNRIVGSIAWTTLNEFIIVAVPMFILLGELLLRSGVTEKMYRALAAWLSWLPGGLLHTNIGACAMFAATSGSSVATAATIGTVAIPALRERGYDERLSLGSIAAGGTLGILIPPSINMIIYGALMNVSIGRLFVGGIIPGIVLTLIFMGTIAIIAALRPDLAGRPIPPLPLRDRLRVLVDIIPVMAIFVIIMGGIYFGLATPTEAAALGVIGALLIAAFAGKLSIAMLHDAFRATVRTTATVLLIILAAFLLNFVLGLMGVGQTVSKWVQGFGLSPYGTMWLLVLVYLVLGCFLETVSMMITTVPIVVPLIVALGFDPVWFGIFLTIMMELSLITPPVGMNLYVVQGIRGGSGSINDIIVGTLPFVGGMIAITALLIYWPALALWLPGKMFD